ncbi:MAG: hypothetical protein L6455_10560 [Kiritimatiellae bacterium]|nr:hypothetical protein [Kiritimatiellia bacterium]
MIDFIIQIILILVIIMFFGAFVIVPARRTLPFSGRARMLLRNTLILALAFFPALIRLTIMVFGCHTEDAPLMHVFLLALQVAFFSLLVMAHPAWFIKERVISMVPGIESKLPSVQHDPWSLTKRQVCWYGLILLLLIFQILCMAMYQHEINRFSMQVQEDSVLGKSTKVETGKEKTVSGQQIHPTGNDGMRK